MILALAAMPNDSPTRLKGKPSGHKVVAWCEPIPLEVVLLFACHAAFLLRLAQTRVLAGRQRQADLTAFAAVRREHAAPAQTRETSSESEKS